MSEEPLKIGQRKITEIVPEKNKSGLSVYRTCFGDFCRASDVDLVIAAKDNEIRKLKRAARQRKYRAEAKAKKNLPMADGNLAA